MFYFDDFCGRRILKSSILSDYDCFFTTREFVLKAGALSNLEDEAEKNRNILKEKLGCTEIISAGQVHSCNIEIVQENKTFYDKTDAIISNIPGSVMMLHYADCTPVILYSKKDNAAAVIHAGWRGTALNISGKTAEKMHSLQGVKMENITALIGPAIGRCCFETGEDVFNQLITSKLYQDLYEKKGGKYYIDLKQLNYRQLQAAGVKNIDISSYCTFCMSDIFFSYRKEKGVTARHSAVVKIKGQKS